MESLKTKNRLKHPGGRPPKFQEARHPVTVTLPERILHLLAFVDKDRAKAIVKVTEAIAGKDDKRFKLVELVEVIPGKAIILVGPCAPLRRITGLHLAEITPARYLLTITPGTPVELLEIELMDALEHTTHLDPEEKTVLEHLRQHLTQQRREKKLTKGELLFVDVSKKKRSLSATS